MDRGRYELTQHQIMMIETLVRDLPLAEFIDAGEHADTIGVIADPTLWRDGHDALRGVIERARALREFQRVCETPVPGPAFSGRQ